MTPFALFSAIVRACPAGCRLPGTRRRCCSPSDHFVTVVGTSRLRDGLSKRYWIRCRRCGRKQGPYTDWQDAWLAVWWAERADAAVELTVHRDS